MQIATVDMAEKIDAYFWCCLQGFEYCALSYRSFNFVHSIAYTWHPCQAHDDLFTTSILSWCVNLRKASSRASPPTRNHPFHTWCKTTSPAKRSAGSTVQQPAHHNNCQQQPTSKPWLLGGFCVHWPTRPPVESRTALRLKYISVVVVIVVVFIDVCFISCGIDVYCLYCPSRNLVRRIWWVRLPFSLRCHLSWYYFLCRCFGCWAVAETSL